MTDRTEMLLMEGLARLGAAAFPDGDGARGSGGGTHPGRGDVETAIYSGVPTPRPHRGRGLVATAAALALTVVAAGLVAGRGATDREPLVTDRPAEAEVRVEPLPAAPFEARSGQVSARIGDETIIWGGEKIVQARSTAVVNMPQADGAAYDLRHRTWRTIAASPLPARSHMRSTVHDGELYVIGGFRSGEAELRDAAAYDPVTDSWRRLPDSPVCPDAAAPTVSGVLVMGRCQEGVPEIPMEAAVYDAASDRWSPVDPPVQDIDRIVERDGVLVVVEAFTRRHLRYDAATGGWEDLGVPPIEFGHWAPGIAITDDGGIVVVGLTQPPPLGEDVTQLTTWHSEGGWTEARVLDVPAPSGLPDLPVTIATGDRIIWMNAPFMAWYDLDDGSAGASDLRDDGIGSAGTPNTALAADPVGDVVLWGGRDPERDDQIDGAVVTLS